MIKFFRSIRQNMIKENRTSKYLLYAIGEIALVVIGILIALSVAEWNNTRNDIETENRLLNELLQTISKDLHVIEAELDKTDTAINNLIRLDSLLKFDIPEPSEELNRLFGTVYGMRILNMNKAVYEDLKSIGFGIIRNELLRSQIINVFENNYNAFVGIKENEFSANMVNRPYYLKNFVSIRFSSYAKPNDLKALWEDSYYKNIVYYRLVNLQYNQKTVYEETIAELKKLLSLIEQNIK
jgi:hypothetical protein